MSNGALWFWGTGNSHLSVACDFSVPSLPTRILYTSVHLVENKFHYQNNLFTLLPETFGAFSTKFTQVLSIPFIIPMTLRKKKYEYGFYRGLCRPQQCLKGRHWDIFILSTQLYNSTANNFQISVVCAITHETSHFYPNNSSGLLNPDKLFQGNAISR